MELLQLKYFCDAAESENFSVTAKKFGVPSSGISQTVKRLEEELGTALFTRGANKISLNEQGKIFYGGIKKALESIENAKSGILDAGDAVGGEIRISVLTNRRIVTRAIEKFRAEYKNVHFIINHSMSADMKRFDLIISDEEDISESFEKRLILTENIVLAMDSENPLAKSKKLTVPDLREQRFITMPDGSSLNRRTKLICSGGGFMPNIVIQSDDPFYVRKYVELGLGIAFVPEVSWQGMFSDKVVLKKIGNYKRNTCIFYNKERYKSKAATLFADMLAEFAQNSGKKY